MLLYKTVQDYELSGLTQSINTSYEWEKNIEKWASKVGLVLRKRWVILHRGL